MVDPTMPWSLKGISDEAREYAREASAAAGMSVGVWLSAVIHAAASEDGIAAGTSPISTPDAPLFSQPDIGAPVPPIVDDEEALIPLVRVPGSGGTIERAVEFVSTHGYQPEGPIRDEDLIEDPEFIEAEIASLERRLAAAEARTEEAVGPLLQEIEKLQRRLERLRRA